MDKPRHPFADGMPRLSEVRFEVLTAERVHALAPLDHRPRFLIIRGPLRERSFSRFLTYEAARLLEAMDGEVSSLHAQACLLHDATANHSKVQVLRQLSVWSERKVWVSPERYSNLTDLMKNQVDRLPLNEGSMRRMPSVDARGDPGLGRIKELQRPQRPVGARALVEDCRNPEPLLGDDSLQEV